MQYNGPFMKLLFVLGIMSALNLSHEVQNESYQKIREKIIERKDLPYVSVERQLELLDLLASCELGAFLIERGGLNGYWTHHIIKGFHTENWAEQFLLEKAPTCLATRQRFQIFKKELQKRVVEGAAFASVPCGLMADLTSLDFSKIANYSLTGIDIDLETLEQGKQLAVEQSISNHCEFLQGDAWDLKAQDRFDVLTSNGLSIYEPSDERVVELYQEFYRAIKPGGHLITSFLTPISEWDQSKIHGPDALLQRIIFADILSCKWQIFRPLEKVKKQLETAGFEEIEFFHDEASIFPTVVARKPVR